MRKVDTHRATSFYCPECEKRTFIRHLFVKRGKYFSLEPAEPFQCKHCGYELTEQESLLIQDGGANRDAWMFTCPECGRDIFVHVTIYEDWRPQCSTRPPSRWPCIACGLRYRLILTDPG
jgi:rubredoxin